MTEIEFNALAAEGFNRIPLIAETYADLDTPLSIYLKLAHNYGEEADIARRVDLVRAAEVELIQSPDQELRFHSGIPMAQAA